MLYLPFTWFLQNLPVKFISTDFNLCSWNKQINDERSFLWKCFNTIFPLFVTNFYKFKRFATKKLFLSTPLNMHLGPIMNFRVIFFSSQFTGKMVYNRRARIRHQCRKTTVLSRNRCSIHTGVEKMNYIYNYRLELCPPDVSK